MRRMSPEATQTMIITSDGDELTAPSFFFDEAGLHATADRVRGQYATAKPFPHVVFDDFLPAEVAAAVLDEFPAPGEIAWRQFDDPQQRKLGSTRDAGFGPMTRHLLAQFNSSAFMTFLEELTGMSGLVPDPHYLGGGLHQIEPGGLLKVHADFNRHEQLKLDRRLNLIVYLNRDWREQYGGHLELWNRAMTRCEDRVLPVFNRCVIFTTTSFSYHGHPEPLTCPPGMTRKSMALYYYSNGRPASEESDLAHDTDFQARPGEALKQPSRAKRIGISLVPPAAIMAKQKVGAWVRGVRGRRRRGRRA
jgi:hypothetical protein